MNNDCLFSGDRVYRYSLIHRWDELVVPRKRICWICLNPSTADEARGDPTVRRIKNFSSTWGFNEFELVNLFSFRASEPKDMKAASDPVGPCNDLRIDAAVSDAEITIAAWGNGGSFLNRSKVVINRLVGRKIHCLGVSQESQPKHPLYLPGDATPAAWTVTK